MVNQFKKTKTPEEGYKELAAAIIVTNIADKEFKRSQWYQNLLDYTGYTDFEAVNIPEKANKKEIEKINELKETNRTVVENTMIPEFMDFIF